MAITAAMALTDTASPPRPVIASVTCRHRSLARESQSSSAGGATASTLQTRGGFSTSTVSVSRR
ncbi:hypothetical protein SPURM210S_00141 [Streptomyces purpurascens]